MTITDNRGEVIAINARDKKINITALEEINITAPIINLNGRVIIGGPLKVTGGSSLFGGNTIPDYQPLG
jgi:phage baseplate assembly protein gpV